MKTRRYPQGDHTLSVSKELPSRTTRLQLPVTLTRAGAILVLAGLAVASLFYASSSAARSHEKSRSSRSEAGSGIAVSVDSIQRSRGIGQATHSVAAIPNYFAPLVPLPPGGETIATFDSSCSTPKTVFILGDTVCVMTSGTSGSPRRVNLVDPLLYVVGQANVLTDPQVSLFTLPTSAISIIS